MKRTFAALAMTLATTALAEPDDPYLWLEDVSGERAMAWVNDQNAKSRPAIENEKGFAPLLEKFTDIANSRDRIPAISKLGPFFYNFWQDAANPRGLWRRTTLAEYRKPTPAWEAVLDLDKLSAAENEQWAWKGATCLYPKYERCLVSISRGGSDAVEVREFDLGRKAFVAGGFRLPESKGGVAWIDEDAIYVSRDFGPGTMTKSGYPRQVKRLRRGQALSEASLVYEASEEDLAVEASVVHEKDSRVEMVSRAITFWRSEAFVVKDGRLVRLDLPESVVASVAAGVLYVRLRDDWKPAATPHKAGSLLALDLEKFLGGDRDFGVLFTPGPRLSLESFTPMKSMVLLDLLDNVSSRLVEVRRGADGKWTRREVDAPKLANLNAVALDRRESDDYFLFEAHRQAVDEFRSARGIADPILQIDHFGGYWIKSRA